MPTTNLEFRKLGEIITLHRGYDLPANNRLTGEVPIISSGGLTGWHNEAKIAPPGVITGRYGSIGEVYYISEPFWPLNTTLFVSNFYGNDPLFIFYLLKSLNFSRFSDNTGVPGVNRNDLHLIRVIHPPLPEQKKIAKILSTWDAAIEQTRKLIDAKKRRKKALMQQLLTGKKRLPGFKEGWKSYRLKNLLKQIVRSIKFDDNSAYHLISVRRRSEGIFRRGEIVGHNIKTKKMYIAQKGDFLISKMQIVHGASALVEEEFDGLNISDSYIALSIANYRKLDANFFNWLSKTPYFYHLTYLASYGVHIEKMTFNLRLFLKSEIKIPEDIQEQHAIVDVLQAADNEINQLEKKLKALEKQKRGLMQKLLTGEVRVR
jgi:type I restriction enzyme S subunit